MTFEELGGRVDDEEYKYEDAGQFRKDLVEAFVSVGASVKQAELAMNMAWNEGHSIGYSKMMTYAYGLKELLEAE